MNEPGVNQPGASTDARAHRRIHLLRHGQSTWNAQGLMQGQTPHPPLTELGREQAVAAAVELAGLLTRASTLVSSDQVRARQTADILAGGLRELVGDVHTDLRLRDQFVGDWQGTPVADLPTLLAPRGLHVSELRHGGGESTADVFGRATRFLADWRHRGAGDLVVVTHGVVVRCLLTVIDGGSARDVPGPGIGNGTILTRDLT
ncbi:histidine phosphatase family protein [Aestuariimicrobium soli]|uniref:histidine phosphatase family protein n=1 Tax=Aestuariimicrobium soli TaxID=2035834 RepID=UPI003EBC3AE2